MLETQKNVVNGKSSKLCNSTHSAFTHGMVFVPIVCVWVLAHAHVAAVFWGKWPHFPLFCAGVWLVKLISITLSRSKCVYARTEQLVPLVDIIVVIIWQCLCVMRTFWTCQSYLFIRVWRELTWMVIQCKVCVPVSPHIVACGIWHVRTSSLAMSTPSPPPTAKLHEEM